MYKGGVVSFAKTDSIIKKRLPLMENKDVFVTTMIDYYALLEGFPGFNDSKKKTDKYEMIESLEKSLHDYYKNHNK